MIQSLPEAVFYNRVQILNRDMTMCAVRAYDAQRRAVATQRDINKAWTRRRVLEHLHSGAVLPVSDQASDTASTMVPKTPWQVGGRAVSAIAAAVAAESATTNAPTTLPGLRVLEALSASGLRAIRYVREVPGVDHVVANDMDPAAAAAIRANAALSGIGPRLLQPSRGDASLLLHMCRDSHYAFDVVDLDPYGTAAPFLDGAVQAVADGGLLAVTCTDMACLAGPNAQDACAAKYGGLPARGRFGHEQALRLVLGAIDAAANRHHRAITPLLSLSVDFYVRVFVRVDVSSAAVNLAPLRTGAVFLCGECDSHWTWVRGKQRQPPARRRGHRTDQVVRGPPAANAVTNCTHDAGSKRARSPTDAENEDGGDAVVETLDTQPACAATGPRATTHRPDTPTASALQPERTMGKVHAAHALPTLEAGGACPHCGGPVSVGGPMWLGRLHDPSFAAAVAADAAFNFGEDGRGIATSADSASADPRRFYDMSRAGPALPSDAGSNDVDTVAVSRRRLLGMLRAVDEELPDAPLYVDPTVLCSRVATRVIPATLFTAALRNAGYAASSTHALPGAVKTDAPPAVWWTIVRAWEARDGNASKRRDDPTSVAHALLQPPDADGVGPAARRRAAMRVARADAAAAKPEFTISNVDFEVHDEVDAINVGDAGAAAGTRKHSGPRYLGNPGAQWGPMSRASDAKATSAEARRRVDVHGPAARAAGESIADATQHE